MKGSRSKVLGKEKWYKNPIFSRFWEKKNETKILYLALLLVLLH